MHPRVCAGMCVRLSCWTCRYLFPQRSEVNRAIKVSLHLFPRLDTFGVSACLCVCVCFCPYSYPFLKVSMTVCVCVGVWWRVYDSLNLCACALPSSRSCPAVGRNPSSKSRECSRCLDRQNTPATSEATRRCLESHPETDASLSSPLSQNKPAARLIYVFTFLFHIALRRNWISTSSREFIWILVMELQVKTPGESSGGKNV